MKEVIVVAKIKRAILTALSVRTKGYGWPNFWYLYSDL